MGCISKHYAYPQLFLIKNQAQQNDFHTVTLPLCFALVLQCPLKG